MNIIRQRANSCLQSLDDELQCSSNCLVSHNGEDSLTSAQHDYFQKHGFLHIHSFADTTEVNAMKDQMQSLVQQHWVPEEETSVFRTDEGQVDAQGRDQYFLESATKVHFFAEKDAVKDHKFCLKGEHKLEALNKAGHGLHMIPGPFRDYTTSNKVKCLVHELGWKDPVVPQSMYICKNASIGGIVTSHQDSTFLATFPTQTCLGLWLALEDATLDNGCLWVRPGSHHEPLRRRFIRNVQHFGEKAIQSRSNVAKGDVSQPQLIFTNNSKDDVSWEGQLPKAWMPPCDGLFDVGFLPMECKAGDLLVFPGQLDHLSLGNQSSISRHSFQLHLIEGEECGITWSEENWLQYPEGMSFLSIK